MPTLTPKQVAQYAYNAGFRGNALVLAVAIAGGESTFQTGAISATGQSLGLWQINRVHDPSNPYALYNPATNATYAWKVSSGGTDWTPWGAYTDGAYKQYMSVAQSAAAAVTPSPYKSEDVTVNGQPFPAITDGTSSYLLWTVLEKFKIPNTYLGNGKFSVIQPKGPSTVIQGVVFQGQTYLPWGSIPGISVKMFNGVFNFKDNYVALMAAAALAFGFAVTR